MDTSSTLHHHTVDLVLDVVPVLRVEPDELADLVEAVHHLPALADRQPQASRAS